MSDSAPSLFDFTPLFPRLEVVDADDQRNIFLNGHLAGRYPCDDKGTERVVVTQLAEVLSLPDRQIAAAFKLTSSHGQPFAGIGSRGWVRRLAPIKARPQGTIQDDSPTGSPLPVSACRRGLAPSYRQEGFHRRQENLLRHRG